MLIPVFEKAYFLQSIGWAVANSFWQAAMLWIIYQIVTCSNNKLSAIVKYQLSLSFIFISAIWFGFTTLQNYFMLSSANNMSSQAWVLQVELINKILPFVARVYFGILGFHIFQFIRQYLQLRFFSKKGLLKAPADIRIFTTKTALHMGIKKRVQVWLSTHVDVPSVMGFVNPIILLPAAVINHLSIDQVKAILLHELAHIKRNDFLLNLLQSSVTLILFFNPFVSLLNLIAKKERENCCDDWVINFRYNQLEYAKALLMLEEQRHQQLQLAIFATNGKKILLQRIKRLFAPRPIQINTNRFQKFQLAGLILVIFISIVSLPSLVNKKSLESKIEITVKPTARYIKQNSDVALSEKAHLPPIIADKMPVNSFLPKAAAPVKTRSIKKEPDAHSENYILAIVNEEALPAKTNKNIAVATAASSKEKDSLQHSPVFIKIEEEQSGKKQLLTYYFKLKKDEAGKTDIKPLLFIKKYSTPALKKDMKQTRHKKRITT